jgi:hypothetical protein
VARGRRPQGGRAFALAPARNDRDRGGIEDDRRRLIAVEAEEVGGVGQKRDQPEVEEVERCSARIDSFEPAERWWRTQSSESTAKLMT